MVPHKNGTPSQQTFIRALSTGRVVKLFVASALVLGGAAGCSNAQNCSDLNRDGSCDNGSGARSGYYGSSGGSTKSGTSSSGISSGSHGGLGSSGYSSS